MLAAGGHFAGNPDLSRVLPRDDSGSCGSASNPRLPAKRGSFDNRGNTRARRSAIDRAHSEFAAGAQNFPGALRIIVADDQSDDGTATAARQCGRGSGGVRRAAPARMERKAVGRGFRHSSREPDCAGFLPAHRRRYRVRVVGRRREPGRESRDRFRSRERDGAFARRIDRRKILDSRIRVFLFQAVSARLGGVKTARTAAAAGGCMLIRREMLERIGGIESIRSALIDDCALAKRVKERGRQHLAGDEPSRYSQRPRVWARQRRARDDFPIRLRAIESFDARCSSGTIFGMAIVYVVPVMARVQRRLARHDFRRGCLGAQRGDFPADRCASTGSPRWMAFSLPGVALFYAAATIESALRYWSGRGGEWKGRVQDAR